MGRIDWLRKGYCNEKLASTQRRWTSLLNWKTLQFTDSNFFGKVATFWLVPDGISRMICLQVCYVMGLKQPRSIFQLSSGGAIELHHEVTPVDNIESYESHGEQHSGQFVDLERQAAGLLIQGFAHFPRDVTRWGTPHPLHCCCVLRPLLPQRHRKWRPRVQVPVRQVVHRLLWGPPPITHDFTPVTSFAQWWQHRFRLQLLRGSSVFHLSSYWLS